MNRIRGIAHVHSSYSFDGRLTLADLSAFIREHRIDFVLMSEHVESLDPGKLGDFVRECEVRSGDTFLLIPGVEIDDLHALFYGIRPVESWEDNDDLARQFASNGALVVVSHPVKIKQDIPDVTKALAEGVEIWNSRHDGKIALNSRIVRYWRTLQTQLKRGLVPVIGIDFHDKHDFIPLIFEIECPRLDAASVMGAIRGGRYHIARSGERIPLDFATGKVAFKYRLYSVLYRLAYRSVYVIHRIAARSGVRAPRALRFQLRRVF